MIYVSTDGVANHESPQTYRQPAPTGLIKNEKLTEASGIIKKWNDINEM